MESGLITPLALIGTGAAKGVTSLAAVDPGAKQAIANIVMHGVHTRLSVTFSQKDHTVTLKIPFREPRKIKNLTSTDAYKKTPRGAKGSNKLYIKMTELTQAASY
jgi:hypothetical protein